MSNTTRLKVNQPINQLVGPSQSLPLCDLGTKRDVLKQILHLRLTDSRDHRTYTKSEIVDDTVKLIKENWLKVNHKIAINPVIVSDQEIARRVKSLWEKAESFSSKKGIGKKLSRGQKEKEKERFIESIDKLFDILTCTCKIFTCEEFNCMDGDNCNIKIHINCSCAKEFKIPQI